MIGNGKCEQHLKPFTSTKREKTQLCTYVCTESVIFCIVSSLDVKVLCFMPSKNCMLSTGSRQLLLASSAVLAWIIDPIWVKRGDWWISGGSGGRHWLNRRSLDLMAVLIFPKSNKMNVTYGFFGVRATSQDVIDRSPKQSCWETITRVKLFCLWHSCIKFPTIWEQVSMCGGVIVAKSDCQSQYDSFP